MVPSSHSINVLEQPTELRKTLPYFYRFIIKRYDEGYKWASRRKKYIGQVCGEGRRASVSTLAPPLSQHLPGLANPGASSVPYFRGFYEGFIM